MSTKFQHFEGAVLKFLAVGAEQEGKELGALPTGEERRTTDVTGMEPDLVVWNWTIAKYRM